MRSHVIIYILCLLCAAPLSASANDKEELKQLRRQLADMQGRVDSLRQQLVADSLTIDSLQNSIELLSAYRQDSIRTRLMALCPDLQQPFSALSLTSLTEYETLLRFFPGDEVADSLLLAVTRCKQYKTEADELNAILTRPFDRQAIIRADKRIMQELRQLVGTDLSQAQFDELDHTTDVNLTRYYQGVIDFRKLIADVSLQLRSYQGNTDDDSRDFCIAKYVKIVEEHKADIEKRIVHIPYLAERFVIYDANMRSNPLQLTAATQQAIDDINNMNLQNNP